MLTSSNHKQNLLWLPSVRTSTTSFCASCSPHNYVLRNVSKQGRLVILTILTLRAVASGCSRGSAHGIRHKVHVRR